MLGFLIVGCLAAALLGCGAQQRSEDAKNARWRMIGMTKENVLACMGPARKKAQEGETEVWSYRSGDEASSSQAGIVGGAYATVVGSSKKKYFCDINIVIKNNFVAFVHYSGPTSNAFDAADEQCGYAVKNCAN